MISQIGSDSWAIRQLPGGLVESIPQTGGNFAYTYDDNGNITSVVQDGVTTSYTYDALGQLIRVVDGQEGAPGSILTTRAATS